MVLMLMLMEVEEDRNQESLSGKESDELAQGGE